MSIRAKLILFLTLATIVPSIIVITFFGVRISSIIKENNNEYLDRLIDERSAAVDEFFDGIENTMFNLKTQQSVIEYLKTVTPDNYSDVQSRLTTSQIVEKLEFFQSINQNSGLIGIFSLSGGLDIYRGSFESDVIRQTSAPELVEMIKNTPQRTICRTVFNSKGTTPYLLVFDGIVDRYSEDTIGYLVVKVNIEDYFKSVADMSNDKGVFAVLDENGEVLFCSKGRYAPYVKNLNSESICMDNITYSVASRQVNLTGWKILMLSDITDIDEQMYKTTLFTLCIVGIFTLCTLAGAIYFYLKIYVPIKTLTDTMNSIDNNLLQVETPVSGHDELGQLGTAFNQLIKRVNLQIEEIAQTEKIKNEMEMQALQAQITPHFLYNTLNAIKCMAHLKQTENIANMSEALIDLLRVIASKERNIPLSRECEYVKAYCELMTLRSGNKYELEFSLAEETAEIEIPKLTLQPIVENSILHGLENDHTSLKIIIKSSKENGNVCIIVSDNGRGIPADMLAEVNREDSAQKERTQRLRGIGIDNVRQRLKMEFGDQTHVMLSKNSVGGTDVVVVFPMNEI